MILPVVDAPRTVTRQVLTADSSAPSQARHALARWLADQGLPVARREDLVLAVSEAVTNAVDHAYRDAEAPGDVVIDSGCIHAVDGSRWVTVRVIDHGVWRPAPRDPGFRGRGLRMIEACTDWRTIDSGDGGTTVTMTSYVR